MKTALRFVLVLGLICLVMGGGVAVLFAAFQARVQAKEKEQFDLALRQVLPDGRTELIAGSRERGTDVYAELGADGKAVRYAAQGAAQGYSSTVRVLASVDAGTLAVHRVIVLSQQETPGLGANVSLTRSKWTLWDKAGHALGVSHRGEAEPFENVFLDRFTGRTVEQLDRVDAMTAATITSNAVKQGLRQTVARIADAIKSVSGSDRGMGVPPASGTGVSPVSRTAILAVQTAPATGSMPVAGMGETPMPLSARKE